MGDSLDSFHKALARFKNRLTQRQLESFKVTTIDDVRRDILRIQDEHGSQKTMMNMSRVQSFLTAIDQFGKVIECFLNSSEFVTFIWGPVKFLLQVASAWPDIFDTLLDAYQQIGEQLPLLEQFASLFEDNPHMRRALELIYTDILEFHQRALPFFSGPVWHKIFRSVWKNFNARFKNILDELRRHKDLIESHAGLIHYSQYQVDRQMIIRKLQQHQVDRNQILEHLEIIETENTQKKYSAVRKWLHSANTNEEYEDALAEREGSGISGQWIIRNCLVREWTCQDVPSKPILWIHGIPGAGKSILASAIIEECLKQPESKTSYFYCVEGDPQKNTFVSILRGLLGKFVEESTELVAYFYDKHHAEPILNSVHLAKQLFELCCERLSKKYIIIDGLDECVEAERRLALNYFAGLPNSQSDGTPSGLIDKHDAKDPGTLRLLIVSQDMNDIKRSLAIARVLALTHDDNEDDIRSYVESKMVDIQNRFELDRRQADYVTDLTCAKARGMFLYAKLVMMNLHDQIDQENFAKAVCEETFPKDLHEAYKRIIQRIKTQSTDEQWIVAKKLLGWMVCARRPLKWLEIQAAVSIDPDNQTMEFDARKLRIHIRDLCGSLIQELPGERLALVHSTAKFHITRTGYVQEVLVERTLTILCLQYLTFPCFQSQVDEQELRNIALAGHFVFQDYAVANWFHHLRSMVETRKKPRDDDLEMISVDEELEDGSEEFGDSLKEFTSLHPKDLREEAILPNAEEACYEFRNMEEYDLLKRVWSHSQRHLEKRLEGRNEVSLTGLADALARNRKILEEMSASKDFSMREIRALSALYGSDLFKCPKVTCFYFHEGFRDAKHRQTHQNQHDRPFRCDEPDCFGNDMGMRSAKDLNRHINSYHPKFGDPELIFAPMLIATTKTPFPCTIEGCNKRFTRKFHLRSHIHNHNQEKPFSCSECGRPFTRANDCRRHEKIHARRR